MHRCVTYSFFFSTSSLPFAELRSVIAESVVLKHQLLMLNRSRKRGPNLRVLDRFIAGFCSLRQNETSASCRHCAEALYSVEFPSGTGAAKVSTVVFANAEVQARTKGARCRHHSRRDPDESCATRPGAARVLPSRSIWRLAPV
jgi:hypothetical protein